MKHIPYPKIHVKLPTQAQSKGQWIATEKVHGANLVIATDGTEVRFGKRKDWLEDDAPFFGWQLIRETLRQAILHIHTHYPNQIIRLFGELYGGCYPHPDVIAVPGLNAVQTGVWYAPDLHFTPFDLMTHNDTRFASFDQLHHHCIHSGLTPPPVIGQGSLQDVRSLPVYFPSRVHQFHNLPSIQDNLAEGFVIKRANGGLIADRPMAKHKIAEFDEARFYEASSFDAHQYLDINQLLTIAKRMMNPMRVASAYSKLGQVSDLLVIEEIVLDVLVDLSEVYPHAIQQIDETELTQHLHKQAQHIVVQCKT